MALIPNTPASNPQPPTIPIGTTDSSWRNGFSPDRPMGEPIINFPTPVVKNVMFFVERIAKNPSEITIELGTPFVPTAGTTFLPFMRDAVLVHVEPVNEAARQHVYRFYYMVPPEQQFRYNIQDMKKIRDGYTLKDTAATGKFMGPDADTEELKDFYEITREWVEPTDSAYAPLPLGSFDPSNEKLDPDFYDQHFYTAYDAQLVYEEVAQFEEEHLRKYFRKVIRVYKTLPGPVVKEFVPYNIWQKGDTVWDEGGPGTNQPESEWVAQTAIKLSREVWAAPLWPVEGGGKEPGQARIPHMPLLELDNKPVSAGWDKGSYPSTQMYTLVSMYKRNSNIAEKEEQNSLSGNCCNPDSRFVRCINTTVTTSQSVDWTANGDVPAVDPPDPGENCSQWRVDSSVVVHEGYSHKETRKSCTTYDQIDEFWESSFDRITNQVYPVLRKIVHNPSTDFDTDWQKEGFTKYTDAVGNTYYGRKLEKPVTLVPVTVPDMRWTTIEKVESWDLMVQEDSVTPTEILGIPYLNYGINDPNDPTFQGFMGVSGILSAQPNGSNADRGGNFGIYFRDKRLWNLYIQNSYPTTYPPGTFWLDYAYYAVNPQGPWYTEDGQVRVDMEMAIQSTLYAEIVTNETWTFPVGNAQGLTFFQRDASYTSEMMFSVGSLPSGIQGAYLDIQYGRLNLVVIANPRGSAINGTIPILINGEKAFDIDVETVDLDTQKVLTVQSTTAAKQEYHAGDYVLNAEVVNKLTLSYSGQKFPYFQFNLTLCALTGSTFKKVATSDKIQRVVLRQWVNPCYAVDSYMQIPGIGYYKKYTTTMNYSFPAVFGSVSWVPWNTRPDLSGKNAGQYFPQTRMMRDSYSGPCTAVVEEAFSPDGTWPKGWGLGTSVQFTTNSGYFSSPLCDYRLPACLHGPLTITVVIGNQDAKWLPGAFNTAFPGTTHTDWKPVTSYYASPWNGGMMCKKVTIYPPS